MRDAESRRGTARRSLLLMKTSREFYQSWKRGSCILCFMKCLLLLVFGAGLSAQDAGMVLRTSVTYNTQKATLQLTEAQRKQADELSREAQQANQAGKY